MKLVDIGVLAGGAAIAFGVWLIYPPVGFIVVGLIVGIVAIAIDAHAERGRKKG